MARWPHVAQDVYECGPPKIVHLLKTFFSHQFSLVFMYLMCGPRQLLFFQCGPETSKSWTPLVWH